MLRHDPGLNEPHPGRPDEPIESIPRWRNRLILFSAFAGVALAAVAVGVAFSQGTPGRRPAGEPTSRIVLVIGGPAPTANGFPVASVPTIASTLADGAEALRRQGIPVQVAYTPGFDAARDRAKIMAAAARSGLMILFPAAPADLADVAAAARRNPETRFVVIDNSVSEGFGFPRNVTGMPFNNQELGYLAGYLAANEAGIHGTVSAVGGEELLPVSQIITGFRAGVARAGDHTHVLVGYSLTFSQTSACERVANTQISAGSTVVFDVAGTCGIGALLAADTRGVASIGVDADLSALAPSVLASAVKRWDYAVELATKLYLQHHLPQGRDIPLNLGNDGVELVGMSDRIPPGIRACVEQLAATLRARDNAQIPIPPSTNIPPPNTTS